MSRHIEKLLHPELREEIHEQIEKQYWHDVQLLNAAHILEFIPELNTFAIRDEQGRSYPLPTFETVWQLCEENWQVITEKWPQGFTKLQLTPMAASPSRLLIRIRDVLIDLNRGGKLHLPTRSSDDTALPENFEGVWDTLSVHPSRTLLYFPRNYSTSTHGSITKSEVLAQIGQTLTPGWSVSLIEDLRFLSPKHKGKRHGKRVSIVIKLNAENTLFEINEKEMYRHETPFTVEESLTHFFLHVMNTNEIMCAAEQHNAEICLGNYFDPPDQLSTGRAPSISWYGSELRIERHDPTRLMADLFGCRTAVRLNKIGK